MKQTNQILRITFIIFWTLIFYSCQQDDKTNSSSSLVKENFITIEKAMEMGNQLTFDIKSKNTISSIEKRISEISPIVNDKNETFYYVINYEGGGFALLAADNRSTPILSYNNEGYFDINKENQPEGLIY